MGARLIVKATGAVGLGLLVSLGLWIVAEGAPGPVGPSSVAPVQADPSRAAVTINEVQPIPSNGEHEWVELRCWDYPMVYLPLVLRASGGESVPARTGERYASAASMYDICGWQLTDEDGNIYTIPEALPALPPGGYVVVHFDGQGAGADDYDFGDGVANLHTAVLTDVFEDDVDQVALYSDGSIVDFVPYGDLPGTDGDAAPSAGIWHPEVFVGPTVAVPGGEVLGGGGSIGLYPMDSDAGGAWTIYGPGETTPGADNPAPAPHFGSPPPGVETTNPRIPFGWSNVADSSSYQFQLAATDDFASPVISEVQTTAIFIPSFDLAEDTYHYRVRGIRNDGSLSAFSAVGEVTVIALAAPARGEVRAQEVVTLAVTPQLQHKDTMMLCVHGHHRDGNDRWDRANEITGTGQRTNDHDDMYCTRASISMIVDYHAGHLSQDRISFHHFGGGDPEGDLGQGLGLWPDELCTTGSGVAGVDDVFTWAMQGEDIDCDRAKPSFEEVRGWMDSWRPCLFVEEHPDSTHSVVVAGYNTVGELVYRIDPWTATGSWISYDTWDVVEYLCPGQDEPRDDEDSLTTDSDSDGIIDFDEVNRLATSENDPDSDDDGVNDKWDLYEVYFNRSGSYSVKALGADMDNDGLRKEVDPDNDNGGSLDGCEDYDDDGRRDVGETSNFWAGDDLPCVPVMDHVYITDFAEVVTDTFRPGEAVVLWLAAENHTPETFTGVDYYWSSYGPSGALVDDLSYDTWNVDVPPGEDELWWISDGVPDDAALGTYAYTGTVSYMGASSSAGITFTVAGSPISITLLNRLTCKGVEDNLPVGVTANFSKSQDDRVYAWAAWEGATRPATHVVDWGWYRPDGSSYYTETFPFTPTVSVYYTWAWLNTEYLYDYGTYTVTMNLDGTYLGALTFDLAAGTTAASRPGRHGLARGGAGSGVALEPTRSLASVPGTNGGCSAGSGAAPRRVRRDRMTAWPWWNLFRAPAARP